MIPYMLTVICLVNVDGRCEKLFSTDVFELSRNCFCALVRILLSECEITIY